MLYPLRLLGALLLSLVVSGALAFGLRALLLRARVQPSSERAVPIIALSALLGTFAGQVLATVLPFRYEAATLAGAVAWAVSQVRAPRGHNAFLALVAMQMAAYVGSLLPLVLALQVNSPPWVLALVFVAPAVAATAGWFFLAPGANRAR